MGIVIRQSLKTVAVTYLGIALGFINTLWLYPYVLSEEQIGLSRTLINAAFLFEFIGDVIDQCIVHVGTTQLIVAAGG